MRKAVVDVDEKRRISSGITTNAKVRKPVHGFFSKEGDATAWVDDDAGKLTKADVVAMAEVFVETMWHRGTWNEAMTVALNHVGIEVED